MSNLIQRFISSYAQHLDVHAEGWSSKWMALRVGSKFMSEENVELVVIRKDNVNLRIVRRWKYTPTETWQHASMTRDMLLNSDRWLSVDDMSKEEMLTCEDEHIRHCGQNWGQYV